MNKERIAGNSDWYLKLFGQIQKGLNGQSKQKVHQIRKQAINQFSQSGFPTTRDEEWKYTDIRPLTKTNFEFTDKAGLSDSDIEAYTITGLDTYRLVFVNGNLQRELSFIDDASENFQVISLREYLKNNNGDPGSGLSQCIPSEMDTFTALNTAFLDDGVIIIVPKNVVVNKPVHIIHINEGLKKTITAPRNLFIAEQGAEAKIIETYGGMGTEEYFTNAVTEIVLDSNASVEHFKIQNENSSAYHISSAYVHQKRDSSYISHNFMFGGRLARNNINTKLDGEGINCILNGLYIGTDKQHIDNHTSIDHAKPHCQSDELYKGILDNHARGVFNGKIFVRQDAQKTNAIQNNNTILISDDAAIDTKPQLEIFADDVRCTHGATVGQLDEDAYFYLRSRGIDKDQARHLLIFAFASDVIDRVNIESLRNKLAGLLAEKLHTIRQDFTWKV